MPEKSSKIITSGAKICLMQTMFVILLEVWLMPLSHISHREVYSQFLKEMIIQPGIAKANLGLSREDVTMEDHVSELSFVLMCSSD